MRKKGSVCDYIEQRNIELLRAFKARLREVRHIHFPSLMVLVVNTPTSRFWVSEARASIILSAMFRGVDVISKMRSSKREMFTEIYRRAVEYRREHPEATIPQVAFRVVNSPAPKFYLHPDCAKTYLFYIRKQWKQETSHS